MHDNRNQRINQISETTLVVGIDIAKRNHYACAVDERGRELKKSFVIRQSLQGFEKFYATILKLMSTHNKKEVIVGFEPTGHYWMNLAAFLTDHGIPYVLVNPLHVKQTKELDDNLQSKNDLKDARVIAKMMPQGYYSMPREMTQIDSELRRGTAYRVRLKEESASIQNRIRRWIDLYFPEFASVIKGLGKQAQAILKYAPLPEDLLIFSPEELIDFLQTKGVRYLSKKKVERLLQVAKHSIGLKDSPEMARMEIRMLLDQLFMYESQIQELTENLVTLARQLPDFDYLTSIPGISETTVLELLSETGSLKRYKDPRQLFKLAGLTLVTNSSGESKGRKRISKRGRRRLRALLYKAVFPLLHSNPAFRALYDYYSNDREKPVTKKEALVILCRKLLQICHGLSHYETIFDLERMMGDMPFLSHSKAA
ncbi:IS110 family RNA-guided transposase [Rossellomorea vietnamensis]|uniref:IS110 family transposase n=2 Tax=Bacillaceae TaxID=186817 RepID=UPI001E340631|nr:IS110 family transposase [Rossellomorea vietnamensis]MCC5804677.1 IS110 family transposase [Rossellomorea vietnamensis]